MPLLNNQDYEFIEFKNRLKTVVRTGWREIGIPDEEVESVYSHIASTKDLVADFNKKYNLGLDLDKIFKMITIKELPKAYTQEEKSVIAGGSSKEINKNIINEIKEHFNLDDEFVALYDEFVEGVTNEAKYALMFSKFESDLQAVDYYKRGLMQLDPVLTDIEYYPEDIKAKAKARLAEYPIPPLGWLTYDSTYYVGNELFTGLSDELIQYCIKLYEDKKTTTLK